MLEGSTVVVNGCDVIEATDGSGVDPREKVGWGTNEGRDVRCV